VLGALWGMILAAMAMCREFRERTRRRVRREI